MSKKMLNTEAVEAAKKNQIDELEGFKLGEEVWAWVADGSIGTGKISGFHESAWGARGVTLGSDVPREVWQAAIEQALAEASHHPRVLQVFRKPRLLEHPIYPADAAAATDARPQPGRLRLCPYYTVEAGTTRLTGALATFGPADKKIIHGMQDAALLPCRRVD
jgi:hypothetical protein